jgi:hypothetical protein
MQNVPLMVVLSGLALAGCTSTTPLKADYGRSVRQLSDNQVYDPRTLNKPSVAAPEGADPEMINLAVTSMRTEATDRKEIAKPVVISIGGQGGQ